MTVERERIGDPGIGESGMDELNGDERRTGDPGVSGPETNKPGTAEPETAEEETAESGTARPEAAEPGRAEPETAEPGTTGSVTTGSGTTEPVTAASCADDSAIDEQIDRTLRLLWRDREVRAGEPVRGRRPTLTVARIVVAAVAVADAEGLPATSMHRVAKELGAGTMTLYTYVPGKTELLDLMVDDALVERRLPKPGEPRTGDWRAQVKLYSDRTREAHRRHPWLREMSRVRPALGPGQLAGQEYLLSIVDGLGLAPRQAVAAANSIATHVDANAALEAESVHLERSTGQSNDAWWDQRSSFWGKYFDIEAHPAMSRTWLGGGFDQSVCEQAAEAYEFGLERLLDGIELQVTPSGRAR